jgi:hypothetical protein
VAGASDFDLLVIGGGLAGASLATVLAREGASVLVVEREGVYRDRVRGEVIAPWGCAEAKRLGLFELLLDGCGREVPKLVYHLDGVATPTIDLRSAQPHCEPSLAFRHAEMQEVMITEATSAGATVWRPAKLAALTPGDAPAAEIAVDGTLRTVRARLIVGADGRDSLVAHLAGFERLRDPDELLAAGLLVQGEMDTQGGIHFLFGPGAGRGRRGVRVASGFYHGSAHPLENYHLATYAVRERQVQHTVPHNGDCRDIWRHNDHRNGSISRSCLTRTRKPPVLEELVLMELGPCQHEPKLPAWQAAVEHLYLVNPNLGASFSMAGVKVGPDTDAQRQQPLLAQAVLPCRSCGSPATLPIGADGLGGTAAYEVIRATGQPQPARCERPDNPSLNHATRLL